MEFEFSTFIGRFHPLFVHLPIGMIILTLVLEVIGKSSRATLSWMWLLSFLTAVFSIFTGWQLTLNSSYPESTLFWHKWLGITVASGSLLIYLLTKFREEFGGIFSKVLKLAMIVILSIGGHLGGQLTHGDSYLVEAAPGFIKKLAGYESPQSFDLSELNADSLLAYDHLIYPLLEQKCVSCHNEKSASGNLNMTSKEAIMEGGDGGEVVVGGDAFESELFRRVTLEHSNVKFMPTKGAPMTFHEMVLLKWWLNAGAEFEEHASNIEMSDEVIQALLKIYQVDFSPRPWYEKDPGPEVDSLAVESLTNAGFKITDLSSSDNYLEIGVEGESVQTGFSFDQIAKNILILDLKNAKIPDDGYDKISTLGNLIRLQLNGTSTTSEDVRKIKPLRRLESINLFNTEVDDSVLDHLSDFPSLKRIYTWQSKVTPEGIAALIEKRPDIQVENGMD